MIRFFCLFALAAGCFLSGCAVSDELTSADVTDPTAAFHVEKTREHRLAMIGSWYRKQLTVDGGVTKQLSRYDADGTYLFQFEFDDVDGLPVTHFESGRWGVSGGLLFTIGTSSGPAIDQMQAFDPEDHTVYWAYEVLRLSKSKLRYRTAATGNVFEAIPVSSDFVMP